MYSLLTDNGMAAELLGTPQVATFSTSFALLYCDNDSPEPPVQMAHRRQSIP